jgi:hypothetical protein
MLAAETLALAFGFVAGHRACLIAREYAGLSTVASIRR